MQSCKYKNKKGIKNMKRYIGTKIINAKPMNRLEYNDFRGWTLPDDEDGSDNGMLIEDIGGIQNTNDFNGYVQWVTIEEFNRIYKTTEAQ
jgi:hypothetical protein